MATSNLLSSVFGRSPIGPIQKHIAKAHECATELVPFFDAVLAENWPLAEASQQRICDLEHEADEIKKQVRLTLPSSLFMPVPREDLLDIVSKQDKIANRAKDVAGLVLGRHMSIPKPMHEDFRHYVQRCIETSAQALRAMNELDELMETGFGRREVSVVQKMIEELDAIESDTDALQIENRRMLFKLEAELPPVDVMFLYKIIEGVGDLADRASRVGSYLQLLLAR